MDKMTPEQRHRCMAAVRSRDTKPELVVRRWLWARGFRYRLCDPRLPGHPDLVLRRYRTAVFVNGCFWHGHQPCSLYRVPQSNVEFWQAKVRRNRQRDQCDQQALAAMGWHCVTVWECQLRPSVREATLESLAHTLNHIYLADRRPQPRPYAAQPAAGLMVAEPAAPYGTEP